jgi:hypothetical protein
VEPQKSDFPVWLQEEVQLEFSSENHGSSFPAWEVVPIWRPFYALRTKQRYASASEFGLQVCFSKSSRASRLKASAATVLSRRGVVIPHVQREQHQPLKSSPSIEMRWLFMCVYLLLELRPYLPLIWHHVVAVNSCR